MMNEFVTLDPWTQGGRGIFRAPRNTPASTKGAFMSLRLRRLVVIAATIVFTAARGIWTTGQTSGAAERFTAFAVNMGNIGPTRSGTVEMVVTRWSTESERGILIAALLDHGPDALLNRLRDIRPVGYIRTPNSLGYELHFAQDTPGEDGGRRVILATDRPISFWEAANQPRSIDYPFTLIELHLNRDGEGEGKMSIATKITGNKEFNLIELEDYATQPVRLMAIRSSRRPTS
jgi:hypothetical protein